MLRLLLVLASLLSLPACTWLGARARINPSSIAAYPDTDVPWRPRTAAAADQSKQPCRLVNGIYDSKQGAIDLDCFQFPEEDAVPAGQRRPAYDRAAGVIYSPTALTEVERLERARVARNRLAGVLLKHADDACLIEKGRLVATQSTTNFLLSFLTQSLSGASTIVGGDRAKSILSGLATLSAGTQDNVNATFYRNQLTTAIGRSLDQERSRLLEAVNASKTQAIDAFTVDDMIVAVNRYHQVCSFEHGLQVLIDAATDAKGAASALDSRARDRALEELYARRNDLTRSIDRLRALKTRTPGDNDRITELEADRKEIDDKIQGIVLARAQKLQTEPSAGDTSEVHPPEEAPPANPDDTSVADKSGKKGGTK